MFVLVFINLLGFPHKLAAFLRRGSERLTRQNVPDLSHKQKFRTLAAAASLGINVMTENLIGFTGMERTSRRVN